MRATPFLRNVASAALKQRVRRPQYLSKLTSPEALAPHFKVRVAMDFDTLNAMANGGLAER